MYLRIRHLVERFGISARTIRRLVEAGDFPSPIILGPRTHVWKENDIEKWATDKNLLSK